MHRPPPPPRTEAELVERAQALAGRQLAWVAERYGMVVPEHLRHHKGWMGQLLERALGASAGSRAEPDFPQLGIELKSIPVDAQGSPKESTYVAVAPIDGSMARTWEASWVRRKLAAVLWVPILGEKKMPPGERMIGGSFVWRPNAQESAQLQADWEELAGLIALGKWEEINARHGQHLQLRPKAASSRELAWVLDEAGEWVQTNPKGFYLRQRFTKGLIQRHLLAG